MLCGDFRAHCAVRAPRSGDASRGLLEGAEPTPRGNGSAMDIGAGSTFGTHGPAVCPCARWKTGGRRRAERNEANEAPVMGAAREWSRTLRRHRLIALRVIQASSPTPPLHLHPSGGLRRAERHRLFAEPFELCAQLSARALFELAHALFADAEDLAELLQRHRLVRHHSLFYDQLLALREAAKRFGHGGPRAGARFRCPPL